MPISLVAEGHVVTSVIRLIPAKNAVVGMRVDSMTANSSRGFIRFFRELAYFLAPSGALTRAAIEPLADNLTHHGRLTDEHFSL